MTSIVYNKLDEPDGDKNVGPEGLAVRNTLLPCSFILGLKTLF